MTRGSHSKQGINIKLESFHLRAMYKNGVHVTDTVL